MPSSLDTQALAIAIRYKDGLKKLRIAGVTDDHFEPEWVPAWLYLLKMNKKFGHVPGEDTVISRFPDLAPMPKVRKKDVPMVIHALQERRRFATYMTILVQAFEQNKGMDHLEEMIQGLQGKLNRLHSTHSGQGLVDLFSPAVRERMKAEILLRREEVTVGIPTGFPSFDQTVGGLQKKRMVVIIGRPGLGKSWLDLFFVRSAILAGRKVLLYPLEMSLEETAMRLYTLFSYGMTNGRKVIKNTDLTMGRITLAKLDKFLDRMESLYGGKLMVADIGSTMDAYTNERIEAEVEIEKPDMFWVDYLTLMKAGSGRSKDEWGAVAELSQGIKSTAMRQNVVGGVSAQVNRQAISVPGKGRNMRDIFLPRLEHIAYGDSIGQDADQVISINRVKNNLYYALVKNRNGPEIDRTKVRFLVDTGHIEEIGVESEDAASE